MIDITKCSGKDCPMKDYCYRFIAPADDYQSIFVTPPIKPDGNCDEFMECGNEDESA